MKKKKIFWLLALVFILSACSKGDQKVYEKFSYNFFGTFDTIIQTSIYAESEEKANEHQKYIEDRLNDLHKKFNSYEGYEGINNVYTINQEAGQNPVKVSDELFNLINQSIDFYHKYSDRNDISFGNVTKIWKDYSSLNAKEDLGLPTEDRLPKIEELEESNSHTNIDNIVLDQKEKTVYLKDQNTKLDVGAVAKGYAVELVMEELRQMGADSVMISAGGNVKVIGKPLDGQRDKCGIGIRDPENAHSDNLESSLKETLFLDDTSIVTSGDYERFFTVDGKNYHHIIDKKTLYPAEYFRSITIVTKDSGLADFLSTAIFMLPLEGRKGHNR